MVEPLLRYNQLRHLCLQLCDITLRIHSRPQYTLRNLNMDKDQQKKNEGEKEFKVQPIKETGVDPKFAPFNAHPGPARTQELPQQEGTKEDREARKAALNK
ncbi:hypothetical protein JDV02_010113 [Purpureocillium takamizusanense]|uniref:Uncharacterized protein n=1 Tax=Purpureocillium takamizusanense TaxID=2060973 RepID=A0A9Q8QT56_9HYPO|nr:uncharacterized protein JDV02_010113 [Purpureocillium takamizusanense]UNI24361.1 hypothetical protein JDV02_010113 [Purpureocillium takamizusanense]